MWDRLHLAPPHDVRGAEAMVTEPTQPRFCYRVSDGKRSFDLHRSFKMKHALRYILSLAVAFVASGCGTAALVSTAPDNVASTGLAGTVMRGPVTPVCRVDVPCEAPFSASFDVRRDGVRVAGFQSDQEGKFTVMLAPGTYDVVPAANAPLMNPSLQAKTVTVDRAGLTEVHLLFDTGIR